jgi:TrmH family RNA methyltransferase
MSALDRIRVVLVRPKNPGNVGAVARAMKNMGLVDLVLVAPRAFRRSRAEVLAIHARDVLERARVVASLAEAVADCGRVFGTTCRPGAYRRRAANPREAAVEILEAACGNPVALVFGPEDTGLSNEDLRLCDALVRIPSHADYPSLNVAQAAVVCFYEIFVARHRPLPEPVQLATSAEVERLLERWKQALLAIGFLHEANPDRILFSLRRLLGRALLEKRDAAILLGIASQILWFAQGGREVALEKARRGLPLK